MAIPVCILSFPIYKTNRTFMICRAGHGWNTEESCQTEQLPTTGVKILVFFRPIYFLWMTDRIEQNSPHLVFGRIKEMPTEFHESKCVCIIAPGGKCTVPVDMALQPLMDYPTWNISLQSPGTVVSSSMKYETYVIKRQQNLCSLKRPVLFITF